MRRDPDEGVALARDAVLHVLQDEAGTVVGGRVFPAAGADRVAADDGRVLHASEGKAGGATIHSVVAEHHDFEHGPGDFGAADNVRVVMKDACDAVLRTVSNEPQAACIVEGHVALKAIHEAIAFDVVIPHALRERDAAIAVVVTLQAQTGPGEVVEAAATDGAMLAVADLEARLIAEGREVCPEAAEVKIFEHQVVVSVSLDNRNIRSDTSKARVKVGVAFDRDAIAIDDAGRSDVVRIRAGRDIDRLAGFSGCVQCSLPSESPVRLPVPAK